MFKSLGIALCLLWPGTALAQDASLAAQMRGTVYLARPSGASCSGSVIATTGTTSDIVSAAHCYKPGITAYEQYPGGAEHSVLRVLVNDPANDLLVLRVAGALSPVPVLTRDDHPQKNDPVWMIGCPDGPCNVVSDGTIITVDDPDYQGMVISADGFPGMSGCPIFWQRPNGEWVQISVLQDLGPYPVFDVQGDSAAIYRPKDKPGAFSVGISPGDFLTLLGR